MWVVPLLCATLLLPLVPLLYPVLSSIFVVRTFVSTAGSIPRPSGRRGGDPGRHIWHLRALQQGTHTQTDWARLSKQPRCSVQGVQRLRVWRRPVF